MSLVTTTQSIGRIMVVDEDPFQGRVLFNVIQAMKVGTPRVYNDFEEARKALERGRIDCLVLDWFRTRDYGLALAQIVRAGATAQPPDLPLVLCTARTLRRDIFAARDLGISEVVVKPLIPEQLYLKLMSACHHPRTFIHSENYTGPDRRRRSIPFDGPERRGRAGLQQDAVDDVMDKKVRT